MLQPFSADDLARAVNASPADRPSNHDHRDQHRPDREQEQAGRDQQQEADPDRDRGENAGRDDRRQARLYGTVGLADRPVGPSVADVADELDEGGLNPEVADDADDDCDHTPEQARENAVACRSRGKR